MSLTQPFNLIDLITPKNAPRAEAKTAILSSEQNADVDFALTLKKRIVFSGAAKQILTSAEAIKTTVAIKSVQTAIGDQNETKATDGASRGFEQTPIAQNETSGQTLIAAKEPPIKPLGALAPQNQAGESDVVWVKEIEAVLAAANDETPQTLAANANEAKPPQAAIAAFEANESARAAIARLNQNANASAVQTLYSVERRFRAIGRQGTLTELVEFANKNDLAIAKISLVKTNAPASQSAPLTKPIESPTQKTANTPREINAPIKTEKAAQALNVLTAKTQTTANRSNEIADKTPRFETNAKTPLEPATDQKIENKPTISVINEKTANQTIKTAQAPIQKTNVDLKSESAAKPAVEKSPLANLIKAVEINAPIKTENTPQTLNAPLTKPIESPTQKTANTPREINAPIKTEKAAQALNVLTAKTQTTANRSNEIADKTPRFETNAKTPLEPVTDQKIENKPIISVINEKTANQTIKTAQAQNAKTQAAITGGELETARPNDDVQKPTAPPRPFSALFENSRDGVLAALEQNARENQKSKTPRRSNERSTENDESKAIAPDRLADALRAKTALYPQSNAVFASASAFGSPPQTAVAASLDGLPALETAANATSEEAAAQDDVQTLARQDPIKTLEFKIGAARSAARYFASRLSEAAANYKPPITRVSIEMSPKELGLVEVTLIKRGDRLIVSAQSSAHTIALLTAHSADLRQNLAHSGYDQVQLRYYERQGDQSGEDRREKERKQREREKNADDIENVVI